MGTITVGHENSAPDRAVLRGPRQRPGGGAAARLAAGQPVLGAPAAPAARGRVPRDHLRPARVRPVEPAERRATTSTRSPATSTRCWRELDLRDVTLVGFSLGTGELARYIGTLRHRAAAQRACSSRAWRRRSPSPPTNPNGVDAAGVAGVQQAILDDRYAWLTGLIGDFLNLDEYLGKRVSEDTVRAMWNAGAGSVADARRGRARPAGWTTSPPTSRGSTSRR